MNVRWTALRDRMAASLFVVPMLCVVGAIGLAQVTLRVDRGIDRDATDLPLGIASTVESARAVLSTIAGATITVAGIAFSIALLVLQLTSSQYSPRVVQGLFRDPFNKRVVGLEVGTFTFCLVVLRSVRTSLESNGDPVIPNVSVAVAVVLGIASILGIVAFINHNAHTMEVSQILSTVAAQTIEALQTTWPERSGIPDMDDRDATEADGGTDRHAPSVPYVVRSSSSGWVRYVDYESITEALPRGAVARLEVAPGDFTVVGGPLCTMWPRPAEPEPLERVVDRAVRRASTRTMAQDPSYGVRQLVDVALRALSPGVNDPTTAEDAIRQLSAVLADSYDRGAPPKSHRSAEGGRLDVPSTAGHGELTDLAFAEIRRAASTQPRVAAALIESQGTLLARARERGLGEAERSLHRHARLTIEGCVAASLLPEDLAELMAVHTRWFGDGGPPTTLSQVPAVTDPCLVADREMDSDVPR